MGRLTKIAGAAGMAAAAYLSKSENREKMKNQLNRFMKKFRSSQPDRESYESKLGRPVDLEDAKMVEEGAMTSVKYYNEKQEELH